MFVLLYFYFIIHCTNSDKINEMSSNTTKKILEETCKISKKARRRMVLVLVSDYNKFSCMSLIITQSQVRLSKTRIFF